MSSGSLGRKMSFSDSTVSYSSNRTKLHIHVRAMNSSQYEQHDGV